jgi:hypothetical protein
MNFTKEITDKICYLYNEVGDICMLQYINKLDLKDGKAKNMLNNMIELNDKMLDTDIYYKSRKEFLTYLGFSWNDDNGLLEYTADKLAEDSYYYVVFALGRDLIKGILPYYTDDAYDFCKRVANDFEKSAYNVNTKGLYECLEEYIKDNFYLKDGEITWKGRKIND